MRRTIPNRMRINLQPNDVIRADRNSCTAGGIFSGGIFFVCAQRFALRLAQTRLPSVSNVLQWLKWLMKITPYCKN